MTDQPKRALSAGDLEVMELLWNQGPMTLAEAHQAIGRGLGYTTVQTRLNRLAEKGVLRKTKERPTRYVAAVGRESVSKGFLDMLLKRVSGGSVVPLVAQLVAERTLTEQEVDELKVLIAEAEKTFQRNPGKGPKS